MINCNTIIETEKLNYFLLDILLNNIDTKKLFELLVYVNKFTIHKKLLL